VWNAETLLPLFGTGVLACTATPRDVLEHSLRALIFLVATNKAGWGAAAAALEDAVMRAGGGNSLTGSAAATAASTAATVAGGGAGVSSSAGSSSSSSSTAAAAPSSSAALSFILTDVLARATGAADASIRVVAAGLYRSLIPLLPPAQVRDAFLPAVKRLAADTEAPVVKAAVSALATVYSSPSANDEGVRAEVNAEVSRLLAAGPKDVIVLILRALIRAVPFAAPPLRDEFILDCLLSLNARVVGAARAGAEAMREIVDSFGLTGGVGGAAAGRGELHDVAKDAVKKARRAAMQVRVVACVLECELEQARCWRRGESVATGCDRVPSVSPFFSRHTLPGTRAVARREGGGPRRRRHDALRRLQGVRHVPAG